MADEQVRDGGSGEPGSGGAGGAAPPPPPGGSPAGAGAPGEGPAWSGPPGAMPPYVTYGPGLKAWYSGPYPPPGAREGVWSMIWRTATKAVVAAGCFGITLGFALLLPVLILAALVAAGDGGGGDEVVYGEASAQKALLSIPVTGVILGEELEDPGFLGSLPGVVYGYEIRRKLLDAAEDDAIAGVVLELETPGGTIFGARAIADGIREYRERTGKPVVAFVAGLSASGGMYAMAPADLILADYGSLLGSIGVTMGAFEYWGTVLATEGGLFGGGVTTRDGITYQPLTAGRSKDVGAPYRPLTEEEKRLLLQSLEDEYAAFVTHVSEARNIPEAKIRDEIGAMVYGNAQAQALGLIDGTASRQEAYERAAALAGLPQGGFKVVRPSGGGGFWGGLGSRLGLRDEEPAATGPVRVCFPAHTVLAYYGDPLALCAQGR